jgi:Ca2+-binding RTX toxin-like protein
VDLDRAGKTLAGTAGADILTGGVGNNLFQVNDAGDTVVEAADGGYDTVTASVNYTLSANVETLILTGDAVKGTGNSLSNVITGGARADVLRGQAGHDVVSGGAGNDRLAGDLGNDVLDGGTGDDRMGGGKGNDRYIVDSTRDVVIEKPGGGTDTVESSVTYTLAENSEVLMLTGADAISGTGNAGNNRLIGNAGNNVLRGLDGDDLLEAGGGGSDRLFGGAGADTFRFVQLDASGASYAKADSIGDFSQAEGDRIDLSAMDAAVLTAGQQDFAFIGKAAFSGKAGELQTIVANGNTYVQGDLNGDKLIDFVIVLDGKMTLTADSFVF